MKGIDTSPVWRELSAEAERLRRIGLRTLFDRNPDRFQHYSLTLDGLLYDYSKHLLDDSARDRLLALAARAEFDEWRRRLFAGDPVNDTEGRPAWHMALRGEAGDAAARTAVNDTLERMGVFTEDVRGERYRGFSGAPITDVVHIGIGGSDLGPRLALQALARRADGPRIHFVSNIDGVELERALGALDPGRTLVTVVPKSFGTRETLLNATAVRDWLRAAGGAAADEQIVAVTAAPRQAREFGVAEHRLFPLWDWVGGRYSLWSAVGIPVALGCGMAVFRELLDGAAVMDRHFREAPAAENMPLLMALVGVWCRNFLDYPSLAVVPYTERLAYLPAYLQQLEMESNGKSVDRDGHPIGYPTVPVLWGQTGTVGQHAFFQALHQAKDEFATDFIGVAKPETPYREHHQELMANLFAQSEALMRGQDEQAARAAMQAQQLPDERIEALLPYRVFPGNRPSSTLLLRELSPRTLGMLLALYEHKVFCQGVIWNVNSFDQWGVELGKQLARDLLPVITTGIGLEGHDSSTRGLVETYRKWE